MTAQSASAQAPAAKVPEETLDQKLENSFQDIVSNLKRAKTYWANNYYARLVIGALESLAEESPLEFFSEWQISDRCGLNLRETRHTIQELNSHSLLAVHHTKTTERYKISKQSLALLNSVTYS